MEGGDANDKPALLLRLANVLALIGIFAANGFAGKNIGTVARRWSNHIKPDGWRVLLRVSPLAIIWRTLSTRAVPLPPCRLYGAASLGAPLGPERYWLDLICLGIPQGAVDLARDLRLASRVRRVAVPQRHPALQRDRQAHRLALRGRLRVQARHSMSRVNTMSCIPAC